MSNLDNLQTCQSQGKHLKPEPVKITTFGAKPGETKLGVVIHARDNWLMGYMMVCTFCGTLFMKDD